jgi:hypothetical protein
MRYALQMRTKEMLKRIPRGDFATNMFRTTFVGVVHHGHLDFNAGVAEATRVMRDILGYRDFTPCLTPLDGGPQGSGKSSPGGSV